MGREKGCSRCGGMLCRSAMDLLLENSSLITLYIYANSSPCGMNIAGYMGVGVYASWRRMPTSSFPMVHACCTRIVLIIFSICRLRQRPGLSVRRFSRGPRSMSPNTDSRKLTWSDFAVQEKQTVVSLSNQRQNCYLLSVSED